MSSFKYRESSKYFIAMATMRAILATLKLVAAHDSRELAPRISEKL
jgi:hypothetical protein